MYPTPTPLQYIAIWLHKNFCTNNHTDSCDWYYFGDDLVWTFDPNKDPGHSHIHWLHAANETVVYIDNIVD